MASRRGPVLPRLRWQVLGAAPFQECCSAYHGIQQFNFE
uniref:Uncharacterized protein n=1 Tax=Arundo donax TaxID=35708 RepID=A0A0A9C6D2_ARUDO